ncbi:hypothetical protein Ade02nite_81410 [Paractinoplanes deccanensis]|uniref:Prepilin-type N-terminal cleavage/methylation domain-containing protein n=1 Tax=Paractinoplanes deccanensis TaxID=113561 RepID=A0ABQ3YI77_9ACTN|nr:prepilin-type N-terminal cleavage/methylation domain-containing protein [Actinoplanes deccanensis]GID79500.1 hypothetical protein Ade02nite_81410 [Actinoplanes deccanensis]
MRRRDDDGYTLMELMAAMAVMSIFMAIVTTAILQIYRSVGETDQSADVQNQVETAFVRLDREVRYASAISDPAQVDGDYYVEYLINRDSVNTCVELRLRPSTGQLQRREWAQAVTPTAPSAWTTLTANVALSTSGTTTVPPFTTVAADTNSLTGFRFQRLAVAFRSVTDDAVRETSVTFTALNAVGTSSLSGSGSSNSATCIEGRSVAS